MENLGLVGFTGAGANRLFSALTGLPVPSEYEAAVGVASLPDERLPELTEMSKSKKTVAAGFELVHLALPPGSKPGEGLGAKVVGAPAQLRRDPHRPAAFADGGVAPDPEGDLVALELELVLADIASVEQRLTRQRRAAKSGDKDILAEVGVLEKAHALLSDGTPIRRGPFSADELARLAPGVPAHDEAVADRRQHGRVGNGGGAAARGRRRARGSDRHRSRDRRVHARGSGRDARVVRARRVRARRRRAGGLPPARPLDLLHHRRGRVARLDIPRAVRRRPSARASFTATCSAGSSGPR